MVLNKYPITAVNNRNETQHQKYPIFTTKGGNHSTFVQILYTFSYWFLSGELLP